MLHLQHRVKSMDFHEVAILFPSYDDCMASIQYCIRIVRYNYREYEDILDYDALLIL
jgi:hypothetical protein